MKCFYHSADLDGHCSGAIIKHFIPKCKTVGINYGDIFPWDSIEAGETVYMVDYTLQPFEDMERLSGMCELIWIDHHKTEVEEAKKRTFICGGVQHIGIGACCLVWEYLSNKAVPLAVKLLAEYDVWNHSNPKTLPFQYGFRFFENTWPENQVLWAKAFTDKTFVKEVVEVGNTILKYEEQQNAKFCAAYAFPTEFLNHRVIACNRGFTNSKVFDSVWDESIYDLMMTFVRKPQKKQWTVSLYSTKKEIDCGALARKFGGGGHLQAAGFQCDNLPFDY